jgi:rod shape-determining protein MreB
MICIPSGVTMVEQRAVQEAAEQAGARHTQLIEEPLAAALGAGLDISEPRGSMVVDIGGGTTDIAVISLGGIVNSASLRVAGDKFDEDIMAYVKKEFNVMIGERTAEDVKMVVGAAFATARNEVMDIRGRDMLSGLPKNVQITTAQAAEAMRDSVTKIVDCVKKVLEETPPELAADIMNCGIVLTGGGAMLYGLDELIRRETDIPTALAEEAMSCVAIGCGKALDSFSKFDGKARNVKTGR